MERLMQQSNGKPVMTNVPAAALPVVVVGAGPVGLAAAAHLLERGLDPLVIEAGEVGAGVASWAHVRVFSPWRHNLDAAAVRLLARTGWVAPDPGAYPTGAELRERYLLPLAATPELAPRLRLGTRVVAITRHGRDKMKDAGRQQAPFELVVDRDGRQERLLASAVVDASGTVGTPNPLGASGIPAPGEARLAAAGRLAYGMPNVLAPLIDPNVHSCNTVPPHGALELAHPEPGFYLAGMKSYGRAPTFLMLTGYEQVRSIAAALAGDLEAARRVELVLPAGGACSTDRGTADASCPVPEPSGTAAPACCGPEIVPLGGRPAGTTVAS